MKTALLLLSAGLLAASSASAQHVIKHSGLTHAALSQQSASVSGSINSMLLQPAEATPFKMHGARTTAAGGRWYNMAQLQDTVLTSLSSTFVGYSTSFLWYTPNAIFYSGSGYARNPDVSDAAIIDPAATAFNDDHYYSPGEIAVTSVNSYTVDSVSLEGYYKRNVANHTDVDTLRIACTYGPVSASSNLSPRTATFPGPVTIPYATLYFDSISCTATQITGGGVPVYVQDILLHELDTPGIYRRSVMLTTPMAVPAGNKVGVSITFISGNPAASGANLYTFADTVLKAGGSYDYGSYRQIFAYNNTGGALATPAMGGSMGDNVGLIQQEPAARGSGQLIYFPSVLLPYGPNPTMKQYPSIGIHLTCPSCTVVTPSVLGLETVTGLNSVTVQPNPADGILNISFRQATGTSATVTLTNMVGQTVAAQIVADGKAVIGTSSFPSGVYVYTVQVGGERTTGRVVITH